MPLEKFALIAQLPVIHYRMTGFLDADAVEKFADSIAEYPSRNVVLELDCDDGNERHAMKVIELLKNQSNRLAMTCTIVRCACGGAWPAAHAGDFQFAFDSLKYDHDDYALRCHRLESEDDADPQILLRRAFDLLEHAMEKEDSECNAG